MLPGFDNLRMESFMPIHEGFKTMQDDQEEFTADEINKIHSEEDNFADVQTIKPTETLRKDERNNKSNNAQKNTKPTAPVIMSEEDDTKEFITKYIESEDAGVEPVSTTTNGNENNKKKISKPTATTAEAVETEEKEGFQGSMITQIGTNKIILVTLIITMISFVLNMSRTHKLLCSWMRIQLNEANLYFIIQVIFALLVFIVLRIFC